MEGHDLLEAVIGAVVFALLTHLRAWVKLNPDKPLSKVLDIVAGNYRNAANAGKSKE